MQAKAVAAFRCEAVAAPLRPPPAPPATGDRAMHSAVRTMVPELPPPNVCNEYLRKYRETDIRAEISGRPAAGDL